jgi:hypothetical protein
VIRQVGVTKSAWIKRCRAASIRIDMIALNGQARHRRRLSPKLRVSYGNFGLALGPVRAGVGHLFGGVRRHRPQHLPGDLNAVQHRPRGHHNAVEITSSRVC